jgi:pimeloyl-ACP methyl ester carboxylesterase
MSMAGSQTRLPADGLATLAGRVVHVASRPGSGPPIVLLGGCGVPSYDWDLVADLLPDLALVLLDRPGLLGSPWPGELPQLASEVRTLESLLESIRTASVGGASSANESIRAASVGRASSASEIVGRTIVVAHSMAGFHAEALIRQRPDLVMGLVLADGSVELTPLRPRPHRGWLRFVRLVHRAMVVPALRLPASFVQRLLVAAQSHRRVTAPVSSLTRQTFRDPDTIASILAEQAAYGEQAWDLAELRRDHDWPKVPTIVLTAAEKGGARWIAEQAELAAMLNARQIVVEDSHHLIMVDRPDVVAQAVRGLRELGDDHD